MVLSGQLHTYSLFSALFFSNSLNHLLGTLLYSEENYLIVVMRGFYISD